MTVIEFKLLTQSLYVSTVCTSVTLCQYSVYLSHSMSVQYVPQSLYVSAVCASVTL
jgi:hypothetical protein